MSGGNGGDPCQPIIDAIDRLNQTLLDLQAEEQDAISVELTIIRGLIKNTNQRIKDEEQALQRCRKNPPPPLPPPFVVTFAGTATVQTDNSSASGPFTGNFSVGLTFTQDHKIFLLQGFSVKLQKVSVSQTSGGEGFFDPSTGSAQLEVGTKLVLPIPGNTDATLNFFDPNKFTTEQAHTVGRFSPKGSRLNRSTGEITLAAASTISDNIFVNGTNVQVILAGTFTPLP